MKTENKIMGKLMFAGNLCINEDEIIGIALEMDMEKLRHADSLPMYQQCVVLTADEYIQIASERDKYKESLGL